MNTSRVIAEMLKDQGVKYIFGLPGGQNVEFVEQARQAGLEFILTHREGHAAFMADLAGQLSGVPGVCMSTLGPGSTNLVNGVADALLDRSPMIAITGQISTKQYQTFTHQNVRHTDLFTPVTKWSTSIFANSAVSTMRKALRISMSDRPGPVHVDLHADIASQESVEEFVPGWMPKMISAPQFFGGEGLLENFAARILSAKKPVIIAGMGVLHHTAHDELQKAAEVFGIPVVTTPKAKGVIPEDHPYFAGVIDMAGGKLIKEFIGQSDLIVAVGFDAVELINAWTFKQPVISIDTVANTDQIYQTEMEVVGNIKGILHALAQTSVSAPRWEEAEIRLFRKKLEDVLVSGAVSGKLNPHEVVECARNILPRDTIVTFDVGSHKNLVGQVWKSYSPRTSFVSNGLSAMGFSLPGATAAQLLSPDKKVMCFVGDGGFAMSWNDLQTAVSLKLPIIVVVFLDKTLNRIIIKQQQKGYPTIGTTFETPDMVKLAQAIGANGAMVDTVGKLQAAIEEAAKLNVPTIIGATIDPTEYANQF